MEHQMKQTAYHIDTVTERTARFINDMSFNNVVLGGLKIFISKSVKDANNDETKELLGKAVAHIGNAIEAVDDAVRANTKELAKIKPEQEG